MTDFQADIFLFTCGVGMIVFGLFLIRNPQKYKDWNIAMMTKKNGGVTALARFSINKVKNHGLLGLRLFGMIIICVGSLFIYLSIDIRSTLSSNYP